MIKGETRRKRQEFCKVALRDNKQAAEQLRQLADGLEGCREFRDIVFALSEIFCVSERTILRDFL